MTCYINKSEKKKTQELMKIILRVFPNARIIESRRLTHTQRKDLKPPARESEARAGRQRRERQETYDLFGTKEEAGGGK